MDDWDDLDSRPRITWDDEDEDEDIGVKECWEDEDGEEEAPAPAPVAPPADRKEEAELFAERGDEKTLDGFCPNSENDFLEYAELISHKLRPYEKSFHYAGLLKAVMRLAMAHLKAETAMEVASSVNTIADEKLKAEKEGDAGKKKMGYSRLALVPFCVGEKKQQVHIEKKDDDANVEGCDAYGDDDFM